VGQRLFVNGIDSGVNIAVIGTGTVTLDGPLPSSVKSGAALASTSLVFKQSLDMTLIAPDATNVVVQGTTNKQASNTILNAVQSNVEVYASIDGKFYNHTDSTNTYGNREITEDVPGAGGYGAVARIGLVAGRNIDSLVTDFGTGKPMFSTKVTLTTKVSNGSQQSTTIPLIYDLDLSNTQLQASSFQVTASVQDGEPRSELASVSIDDGGNIVGIYGNGRKIFAGQVALTHFDASQQLVPTGGNSFAPSYMSGTEGDVGVTVGRPGEGSFGALKQNAVEQSNVDLSNELVKLMILQRSYSANSQSMRAFDQTLQDTIRMTS
jgi:flagellar hook-basal body protein